MDEARRMTGSDYRRVERAIRFLDERAPEQPRLADVAAHLGLSEFHFQRLFLRWAGVSPKQFLKHRTLEDARRMLADSRTLLETSLATGLSGPGRLHDLFLTIDSMTPGEFKAGTAIDWGLHDTPFGEALFAATARGLAGLSFVDGNLDSALTSLRARWPHGQFRENQSSTLPFADALRARVHGRPGPLHFILKGTPFQLKVWEALLRIPAGSVVTYSHLARAIGNPNASRAVGSAVGDNPIAYLIPCHRVIQTTGAFGNYRWGPGRKRTLLTLESQPQQP